MQLLLEQPFTHMENASHEGSTNPLGEKAATAGSQLVELVLANIKTDPYEFDGQTWTMIERVGLSSSLGVSLSTFNKIISAKPFVFDVIKIEAKKITLLRVGEKILTHRLCAKFMESVWKKEIRHFNAKKAVRDATEADKFEHNIKHYSCLLKVAQEDGDAAKTESFAKTISEMKKGHDHQLKRVAKALADSQVNPTIDPRRFGCFVGLAEYWGVEAAPKLLRYIIHHWVDFMVGVKAAITEEFNCEKADQRYYEYPSPSVIRRFPKVVVELLEIALQQYQPGKLEKLQKDAEDGFTLVNAMIDAVQKDTANLY